MKDKFTSDEEFYLTFSILDRKVQKFKVISRCNIEVYEGKTLKPLGYIGMLRREVKCKYDRDCAVDLGETPINRNVSTLYTPANGVASDEKYVLYYSDYKLILNMVTYVLAQELYEPTYHQEISKRYQLSCC